MTAANRFLRLADLDSTCRGIDVDLVGVIHCSAKDDRVGRLDTFNLPMVEDFVWATIGTRHIDSYVATMIVVQAFRKFFVVLTLHESSLQPAFCGVVFYVRDEVRRTLGMASAVIIWRTKLHDLKRAKTKLGFEGEV